MRLLITLYATLAFAQAGELHQAARHCEPVRMQQLLASDARLNELDESGMTPLHIAIDERQVACAGLLLKAGADPLARDGNGRTALEAADKVPGMRDWARIRLYLNMFSAGPVAHEELEPMPWSLEYSVLHRQPKVTRMLLEMGVDPNAAGANGTTPLADAALKGDLESVRLLLAAGARPNATSQAGTQPIHDAALGDNGEVIRELAKSGADVDARTRDGAQTPLHYAAAMGKLKAVEALVSLGADLTAKDSKGRTPYDTAEKAGLTGIARFLSSRERIHIRHF